MTFTIAVVLTVAAAFYRASRFDDLTRALSAGLAAPIVIMIVWVIGYFRHVRRRRDWRRFLIFAGRAAVLVTGWVLFVNWNRERPAYPPSYPVGELRAGRISALEFLRRSRAQNPAQFDAEFKGGIIRQSLPAWQELDPSALLRDVTLRITDDGTVMQARSDYVAQAKVDGASLAFQSRVLVLLHPRGTASLESVCIVGLEGCAVVGEMADESERRIRANLDSLSLDGILPSGGECSTDPVTEPSTGPTLPTLTCEYEHGVRLSLTRRGEAEMAREMIAMLDGQGVR